MKLTAFILLIGLTQVSAKGYSQTVTISDQNISLRKVFRDIQKQTGYHFLCTKEQLTASRGITLNLTNASIKEALDHAFEDQPLTYTILNKTIIVRKRPSTAGVEDIPPPEAFIPVTGTVTDSVSGKPLAGVTLKVKGNATGTVSDMNGQFSLDLPEDATLELSYLGYERKEVNVNGRSNLNIPLSPVTTGLNQLVVVGYGVQKKVNITGAVSTIDSKDLNKRVVNNSVQALQGLAPNLNIAANNDAGAADGTMDMNIRGVGSLSSSEPYILIDGVRATKAEFSSMDPNNIESISVLKDAASAAIYGAQAAYGVILVQTKKGRKSEKLQIGVSSDLSWSKLMYVPESINSLKYIEEINQAARNYSNQLFISEETIEKAIAFSNGDLKYGTEQDSGNPNQWLGILSGTSIAWYTGFANTNWWKELYKDFSFRENHNIYVSGGTEKLTYYVSGGLLQDYGQFRYGDENENFSRLNYNSSVSADITKWLTISNTTRFYQKNNKFPATLEGASRGRLFHDMMRWSPLVPLKTPPVKDDDGNILVPEQLTTLAAFNEYNGFDKYKEEDLVSTFKVDLKISDALSIKGDYTFKKNWYAETLNFKKWVFYGPDGNPSIIYQNNQDEISKDWRKSDYTSFNVYANFDRSFQDKHNLNILVGYQQEESKSEGFQVGRKNVIANYLNSLNAAVGDIIGLANPIASWSTLGTFGRISYNFEEKYLFEFNSRYDGSSKFPGDHRFGFFPSVSAGYNIYKEDFWKPLSTIINSMKIRASFGKLGNQNVSGNLYLSGIPVNTQLGWAIGGERPVYTNMPGIVSPDVTWETSTTKNLGADLAFLNYRLSASVDIYQRQTDNMFGPSSALPSVLGTSPPKTNSASLITTGWELSVGWTDAIKDFNYNIHLLLSDNVSNSSFALNLG